jgi:hypothetical protein
MLTPVAWRNKYLTGLGFHHLIWAAAVVLIGFAVRQIAVGDQPPSPSGELALAPSDSSPPTVRAYDIHDLVDRWVTPFTPRRADVVESTMSLIYECIQSGDWDGFGGSTSFIRPDGETLVVGADAQVQRDVEDFLRSLRDAEANTPPDVPQK